MKVAVLGTGAVGKAIASKLVDLGHDVVMGSRTADNPAAAEWSAAAGESGSPAEYAVAAGECEMVFNCTAGAGSLEALGLAGEDALAGKVLVDVANPLDFSGGMPPSLLVSNTDSLGEQIQRGFPAARVVKALNTVNCEVMVDPSRVPGDHDIFMCGNDDGAKSEVRGLLVSFGWPDTSIIDLGDISAARATESYLPLWVRLWGVLETGDFNVKVVR